MTNAKDSDMFFGSFTGSIKLRSGYRTINGYTCRLASVIRLSGDLKKREKSTSTRYKKLKKKIKKEKKKLSKLKKMLTYKVPKDSIKVFPGRKYYYIEYSDYIDVTFKSANPKIAKVDAYGRVTAVSGGKTTITATAKVSKKKTKIPVYVDDRKLILKQKDVKVETKYESVIDVSKWVSHTTKNAYFNNLKITYKASNSRLAQAEEKNTCSKFEVARVGKVTVTVKLTLSDKNGSSYKVDEQKINFEIVINKKIGDFSVGSDRYEKETDLSVAATLEYESVLRIRYSDYTSDYWSDWNEYKWYKLDELDETITIKSADSSIATAKLTTTDEYGYVAVKVKGHKEGTTTLRLEVEKDGSYIDSEDMSVTFSSSAGNDSDNSSSWEDEEEDDE